MDIKVEQQIFNFINPTKVNKVYNYKILINLIFLLTLKVILSASYDNTIKVWDYS